MQIKQEDSIEAMDKKREEERARSRVNYQHQKMSTLSNAETAETVVQGDSQNSREGSVEKKAPFVRDIPKVGRNELCPCGSGKKYKLCHGKIG